MRDKGLVDSIKIEIENLERLNNEMNELLKKIDKEPGFIEVRAAGSIIHDFYCGIEKIFERIALSIDKKLPEGENWHSELLSQMAKPCGRKRDAVISKELFENLKEYLRFRHLFRNIYGFELKWDRFKAISVKLDSIFKKVRHEIEGFLED